MGREGLVNLEAALPKEHVLGTSFRIIMGAGQTRGNCAADTSVSGLKKPQLGKQDFSEDWLALNSQEVGDQTNIPFPHAPAPSLLICLP